MAAISSSAKRSGRASIRQRLNLLVLGSVLFSTLPVTAWFVVEEAQRHAAARWSEMKTAADVLASSAVDAVENADQRRAFQDIRAVSRTPGIIYARIETPGGNTLAETGAGARLRNDVRLDAGAPNPSVLALVLTRSIEVSAPIKDGATTLGKVVVVHRADGLGLALAESLAGVLGIGAATLLLALWAARRMQMSMTRPLAELTASVAAIADKSDFSQRVTAQSQDEVGELVGGFNAMLDAIQVRDRKIEAQVKGLETEVAARTADYVSARDDAMAANAAKSDFLATMSHEIRTPMNGVMVMAELLAAENLPPKARRHAQTIARSGRSLLAVINDILDFSKIEAGKMEVEICAVDILDLVDESLTLFHAKAREKGLELVAVAHPEAPRIVPADPVRLGQVIANLASNALKFTETGFVLIQVETDPLDGYWRLIVRDSGIGIAEDKLASIFSAFTQEDQTTTRRFGGTGLGLSIAKRLVEAMGGDIGVASKPGQGTRFIVRLPKGHNAQTAAPPSLDDLPVPSGVALMVGGEMLKAAMTRRLEAAGAFIGTSTPALVIADAAARGRAAISAPPERLVLLAEPDDAEADKWVRDGKAAGVLPLPLRHRDFDALVTALHDGTSFTLKENEALADAVDAHYSDARVLVVDDGEVNREVALEALARFGIAAETAEDGAQALKRLETEGFDLVLMDGSMPVMDGFEATRHLRAFEQRSSEPRTPVIALTAHVVGAAASAWREAGMDDVLYKPFTLHGLAATLRTWLPAHLAEAPPAPGAKPAETDEHPATVADDLFDPDITGPLISGLKSNRGDFVRKVMGLYRSHAPKAADDIALAHQIGDDDGVARAAHALKSMSLNLGARAVSEAAAGLERAVRVHKRGVSPDEIVAVRILLDRTLSALDTMQNGETPKVTPVPEPSSSDPDQRLYEELKADIARGGAFEMRYQPIFDRTGAFVVSVEALVRWNRGERTPVGPDQFIPLAERTGLIGDIGAFVRRRVLQEAATWDPVPVAINVSPIELDKPDFIANLRALLTETGYDPARLVLEMTETAFLGEPGRVKKLFEEIRAMGIKLALDDFGVGYSSLTALHRFPFDKIKIDKEFVHALDGEPKAALEALAIIQAVSGVGRAFGMQVVAEGIETPTQHSHLKAAGVHAMQGFLFGKPMTAEGFSALIDKPVAQGLRKAG